MNEILVFSLNFCQITRTFTKMRRSTTVENTPPPPSNDPAETLPAKAEGRPAKKTCFPAKFDIKSFPRHVSVVSPSKFLLPRQKLYRRGHWGVPEPANPDENWNNPKTRTKNWENQKTRKCKIKNPKKYTLQQKTFTGERLVSSFFDISLHWLHSSIKEQYRRLIIYG